MKTKRLLSCILVLLLVVSLLPIGAMADDNSAGTTIATTEEDIGTNNGIVETNKNTIETNNGTVGKIDENGKVVDGTGNQGEIYGNMGIVVVNGVDGYIEYNGAGATEDGKIDGDNLVPDATVDLNKGEIYDNLGTVTTNAEGGWIENNDGYVGTNDEGAEVNFNFGTIDANKGTVYHNGTQYEYKEGEWEEKVDDNGKPIPAEVTNIAGGVVIENYGLVKNGEGGEVKENYGIVKNEAGGLLNDMIFTSGMGASPEKRQFTGDAGTYVGTWVDRGYIETTDGGSENFAAGGVIFVVKQAIQGAKLNLKEVGKLFQQDGYEVIGYTTNNDAELLALSGDTADSGVVYETKYEVTEANSWLSLIWGKIKAAVAPASDEPEVKTVKNTVLTSLSADQVKVGAYVRCGEMTFRIIEVTDDSIRVATVGKLSEEALADMLGFLKKSLSDAQIAKLIGVPELLEEELVARFFYGRNEHIAFRASSDLFA